MSLSACENSVGKACSADSECGSADLLCCLKGEATSKTCNVKADCKQCPAGKDACEKKADCATNQECKNGCCEAPVGPSKKECTKNLDCPAGEECVPEQAKKLCLNCIQLCQGNSDCSSPNVCEAGCCRLASCTDDAGCKDRQGTPKCKVATGECVSCLQTDDCAEKEVCRDDRCRIVECRKDSHCTNPQRPICNTTANTCAQPIICKTDDDCAKANPGTDLKRCDPTANGGRGECRKGSCSICTTDSECGGNNDFCVGKDKGLKDGPRCLIACTQTADCPQGFFCTDEKIPNFKICFPQISYCVDPCAAINCPNPKESCVEGKCIKRPEPCDPCTQDSDCGIAGSGSSCIEYPEGKFCTKPCNAAADCPTDLGFTFQCVGKQCLASPSCKK